MWKTFSRLAAAFGIIFIAIAFLIAHILENEFEIAPPKLDESRSAISLNGLNHSFNSISVETSTAPEDSEMNVARFTSRTLRSSQLEIRGPSARLQMFSKMKKQFQNASKSANYSSLESIVANFIYSNLPAADSDILRIECRSNLCWLSANSDSPARTAQDVLAQFSGSLEQSSVWLRNAEPRDTRRSHSLDIYLEFREHLP